jgi:hypothetical protein
MDMNVDSEKLWAEFNKALAAKKIHICDEIADELSKRELARMDEMEKRGEFDFGQYATLTETRNGFHCAFTGEAFTVSKEERSEFLMHMARCNYGLRHADPQQIILKRGLV